MAAYRPPTWVQSLLRPAPWQSRLLRVTIVGHVGRRLRSERVDSLGPEEGLHSIAHPMSLVSVSLLSLGLGLASCGRRASRAVHEWWRGHRLVLWVLLWVLLWGLHEVALLGHGCGHLE